MSVTPSLIKTQFPVLASRTDAEINLYIADATCQVNVRVWDKKTDLGIKYLAAHMAIVGLTRGGSGGAVSSIKVGDISKNFAQGAASNDFNSTAPGQLYDRLRKQIFSGPILSNFDIIGQSC